MVNGMSEAEMTDGFHLVVEALKLNGVDTIFGVAGIPITDLLRLAQNEGIRFLGPPRWRLSRPDFRGAGLGSRCGERQEVAGQGRRSGTAAAARAGSGRARTRSPRDGAAPPHDPRQGRGLCAGGT